MGIGIGEALTMGERTRGRDGMGADIKDNDSQSLGEKTDQEGKVANQERIC